MPSRLAAPVLTVDAGKMHKVDPRNVESLFGMWMGSCSCMRQSVPMLIKLPVFSKCAESIEEGKRLENLSWRLWNRETFCCEAQPHLATTPAIDIALPRPSSKDVPELSRSVDSVGSEDTDKTQTATGSPIPRSRKQTPEDNEDSALSRSRGKEKHITALGLEHMVIKIKEQTDIEPLSAEIQASLPAIARPISHIAPCPSSSFPTVDNEASPPTSQLQNSSESCRSGATVDSNDSEKPNAHRGSDTSVSSSGGLIKSGSVVHGFSPSQMSSSFRSKSIFGQEMAIPARSTGVGKLEPPKKGMFTLGASSGEDESSFEERMSVRTKKSSLSDGLTTKAPEKPKKPSFREIVQSRRIDENDTEDDEDVIETDDEEDEGTSSSAIEEDDAEWEDSVSEGGHSPPADKTMFQRVESRANLTSRRSMLTMQLHEPQRSTALANAASRSSPALRRSRTSSPNGPSVPGSPDSKEDDSVLTMRGPQSSRPVPIICTTSNTHPPAHSPRTTRRNMLATELTESLRKHLLWERKQKSTTANAFANRRHTAQNLARLQEYPGPKADQAVEDASKTNSWDNHYDAPWEYHARGW